MKKFLIAAAALGALTIGAAGSASAASYGPNQSINQREANIEWRIEQGVRAHVVTFREARNLRAELNGIKRTEAQYRRGGLNRWERNDLDRRLDSLSARVRFERNDRDHRGDRFPDRHGY